MTKSFGTMEKRFFPGGFKGSYSAEIPLAPAFVPQLFDGLVHEPEISNLLEQKTLSNLKGRDSSQQLISAAIRPQNNELLLAEVDVHSTADDEEPPVKQRFVVTTPYRNSEGMTMYHTVLVERPSELHQCVRFQDAGRIIPAELTFFRFGLQKYTPRAFSSLFGLAPVLTGSILIDCSRDVFCLTISEEGLKRKTIPWEANAILDDIDATLRRVCHFDLKGDMIKKVVSS